MSDLPPTQQVDVKEVLRPLLFGLSEEDLDTLAAATRVRQLPADTVICHEGELGEAVYVLIDGEVQILQYLDDETERHLHYTQPGEFFGEMAVLQESDRTATVRTTVDSAILEIGKDSFLTVLGRSPSLGIRLMVRLTNRLRDSDRQAIDALREANEELMRTLRQLERLDRTKTDFIQVAAHELRTPVAALAGYAQMMGGHPALQNAPELRALTEGVLASTERLQRIFNNILDASKVMTGELKIRRSPVSMALVLRGVESEFARAIESRGLTFEILGLEGLPFCPADPDLLYKAFQHLVNNAIKYTPDGGRITVTGRVVDVPELGESLEIAVEDTGIGISPQDIELIFAKFYRTGEVAFHSSSTTAFKGGGPGLGLAITSGLIVAHGGRIWAESAGYDEENFPGSRFVVQLPLNPP
ncbi:MAG: cyclic nucleotide-binding domain-containing protein [Anaerolineae bacterium]|nr:cyclic nucleotide-binding domain-containing protein [Anaerolineae bacterium]